MGGGRIPRGGYLDTEQGGRLNSRRTPSMLEKAMKCQTADELIALFKKEGMEITKAEAEALFEKLQNEELDAGTLDKVAGGSLPSSIPMDDIVILRRRKF